MGETVETAKRREPLYQRLASLVIQHRNCIKTDNTEWKDRSEDEILKLVKRYMPSGSGFDCGTKIFLSQEAPATDRLVFETSFHHMNENGFYDGWTEHTVTVHPSLAFKIEIKISGRNRNEIKDLIHESFDCALRTEIEIG
jgi:hypothetical protein